MSQFVQKTTIPGLLLIERPTFADKRGFFKEIVRFSDLAELGIDFKPVQWNCSLSKPGVIRALHAENWNKLTFPVTGKVFVAVVDLRDKLKSFGRVEKFVLDSKDPKSLYIPKGLANSICVLGKTAVSYMYLVDAYYDGTDTRAIAWNDPDLAIDWPVKNPILSERDKNNPTLREAYPGKFN